MSWYRRPVEYRVTETGCWECTSHRPGNHGYPLIQPADKQITGNRYAWEKAYGPVPEGMCVLHRCDNRLCINPEHLFLGTRDDNAKDMHQKGRNNQAKGEDHGFAKLTEEQVREIRNRLAQGDSQRYISILYGVSKATIAHINQGRTWTHVK